MALRCDALGCMGKTYRAWDVDQVWLLPPSIHDFVARESPGASDPGDGAGRAGPCGDRGGLRAGAARLSALSPGDDGGALAVRLQPRHLLVAADRAGLRGAARLHGGDGAAAAGLPHRSATSGSAIWWPWRVCSRRCCALCRAAGLVKLGHVALDGTKLQANASKHKAMSYGRMRQRERRRSRSRSSAGWSGRSGPTP